MKYLSAPIVLVSILISSGFVQRVAAQASWSWMNNGSQTNPLQAIHAIDTNIIVVVGNEGTIVRTTDGGESWVPRFNAGGSSSYFSDVEFADPLRGMTVGEGGTILHTSDAGETWSPRPSGTLDFISSIVSLGGTSWMASTYAGIFHRSADDGLTWDTLTTGFSTSTNALVFVTPAVGVAVGPGGQVARTTDGGGSWTDQSVPTIYSLRGAHFFNPDTGFVWGDMGVFFKTTDGGATWENRPSMPALWRVTFVDGRTGYASGAILSNAYYKTTDGGDSWFVIGYGAFSSFGFADARLGFGVGGSGNIIRTRDSGKTWQSASGAILCSFYRDISFIDSSVGVVVGWNGRIIRTTNGGARWDSVGSSGLALYNSVALGDSAGFITGNAGRILFSSNRGVSWTTRASGTTRNLNDVAFFDSTVIIAGDSGLLLRSTDLGSSWTPVPVGTTWGLHSVAFLSRDTLLVVGGEPHISAGGRIFRSTDGGLTWTDPIGVTGYVVYRVAVSGDLAIAVSLRGRIYRSTDRGSTWTPKWLGIQDDLYGIALTPTGEGTITTGFGGVYTTSNAGNTWNDAHSITGNWLYSVCYPSPGRALMVGQASTILGLGDATVTAVGPPAGSAGVPEVPALAQNYPNPFNPSTQIAFTLPTRMIIRLSVFDLLGREIATLVDGGMDAGAHSVEWNVRDLPAGVYFYRLTAGESTIARKMLLLK